MPWGIAAAVVGAAGSIYASDKAADAQSEAAASSQAYQEKIYNQQRADLQPWRDAGGGALKQLTEGTTGANADFNRYFKASDMTTDAGYQFRMSEAQKAIERSAASRGNLLGGATAKALTKYSQGVASDEYQNAYNRFNNDRSQRFNRLSSLAGIGQTASNQLGQAGQNFANASSQNAQMVGNAQSANAMATGNAINSALGTGVNTWMQSSYLDKLNNVG